ncbi:OLC1v1004617C5 [Oldenlandia corymbosa var. corymbosa]|uniref:OLC1v1004617C5 n=1 Tax=Oldenlandia corymbosa var. corymbosa TaxID=529605 RepID=A0AAV1DCP1_OLDCO|nr:OLC1v1004617C5 [Oldenlandia corymbosa var. corymbosa]
MEFSSSPSFNRNDNNNKAAYSPSAPPIPGPDEPHLAHPYQPSRAPNPQDYYYHHSTSSSSPPASAPYQYPGQYGSGGYGSGQQYGYGYPPPQQQQQQQQYYPGYNPPASFPPGTDPEVIRSFQMVDRDRSGFIEETELQQALSSNYQRFSLRTIRLLIFLFKNPSDSALRIGPKEFAALWSCLSQWRVCFPLTLVFCLLLEIILIRAGRRM